MARDQLTPEDLDDISYVRGLFLSGQARELREARHLSRDELARAIGVSKDAVALWENLRRVPAASSAKAAARVFRSLASASAPKELAHA